MRIYYYQKIKKRNFRKFIRLFGLIIFLSGFSLTLYIFLPLISWKIYFEPVFASTDLTTPIPKRVVLSSMNIKQMVLSEIKNITSGIDYNNGQNWFPYYITKANEPRIKLYTLTIPKLAITDAKVSTTDTDLSNHLVNFLGTAIPPDKGTAVILGHSTLPQLFDPNNYKTIFANAYTLQIGDTILISIDTVVYSYRIFAVNVVDAQNTSIFTQNYDNSYITLVTCTPPGTTWQRLVIKASLEKI